MKNFADLVSQAMNEPALDRFMKLPLPLRTTVAWGITSLESLGGIENRLEHMLVRVGHGWFARRRLRKEVMADVKALLGPELADVTLAGLSFSVLTLLVEVSEALPKAERAEALPRLIANVRAQAGASIANFSLLDAQALLNEVDPALAHDERTVQERAEAVGFTFEGQRLRNIAIGLSRALKDADGEMSTRRQRIYRAVAEGLGLRLGDDDGEFGCPNCGSESFEVVERADAGRISKPTEFKESTTRGTRTKVMKVGFDRTRESRRCTDCCFEWKFVTKVEQ